MRTILVFSLIIAGCTVSAGEKKPREIVLYKIKPEAVQTDHHYLSELLSRALFKSLKKNPDISVRFYEKRTDYRATADDKAIEEYKMFLKEIVQDYKKIDFIITGTYNINENKNINNGSASTKLTINTKIHVVNLKLDKRKTTIETDMEFNACIQDYIDTVIKEIEKALFR